MRVIAARADKTGLSFLEPRHVTLSPWLVFLTDAIRIDIRPPGRLNLNPLKLRLLIPEKGPGIWIAHVGVWPVCTTSSP